MTSRTLPGDPPVEITLRRSAQARRFSLRVSRLDGRVTLSMPNHAREAEALAFAAGEGGWIRAALARAAPASVAGIGALLPFAGQSLTVVAGPVRTPRVEGDLLVVPPDPARAPARIAAFLKVAAHTRLLAATEIHSRQIGRAYKRLVLRDPRSRWGSCTSDGSLMFSWRLVLAPPEVLDYVAAHEVAHLAEMNHSPAFWAVVARLSPDYARHRAWLRREGAGLHRIDFSGGAR